MEKTTDTKKQKPIAVRIAICMLLTVVFYCLGYFTYSFSKIQHFIQTSIKNPISIESQSISSLPGQINILLLGSDNDRKFTGNPLTQTMMVIHVDYAKKTIDMFSIPRDLWVKMPGTTTYGKIDQAAEYNGIPSAIKVVQDAFGIHIDYYAWVGLYGFIKSIDAIGGININVLHPVLDNEYPTDINSPNLYGYKRLDIQAGMQHLTGTQALEYVRSRHEDLLGDFGRTQRQRELLLAIKKTLLKSPASLTQLPGIFNSLEGQVKTDISPVILIKLGLFALASKAKENQFTLSPTSYSFNGYSTNGQSIVIANATPSAELIASIFGQSAGQTTLKSLLNVGDIQP